jgi:hypothetical protein
VDAAANALATAAWNLPEIRGEVVNLLMERTLTVVKASHSRATELLEPLGELILSTPGADAKLREPVRDILAMYRSLEEPPTPPEFAPDAIKQWGRDLKAEHDAQAAPKADKKRRLWRRSS